MLLGTTWGLGQRDSKKATVPVPNERRRALADRKTPKKKKFEEKPLEEKTLEELGSQIESGKRKVARSFVFAAAALITIVAIGVAWFASNSTVTATGSGISADTPVSFLLGSEGDRQSGEVKYLKDASGNVLKEGIQKTYSTWIDIESGKEQSANEYVGQSAKSIYTGINDLAWRLSGEEKLVPGASGKLEFYIIPQQDGLTAADISLDLTAYQVTDNSVVKSNNDLQKLISGHILLFQKLDDANGYSQWIKINSDGGSSETYEKFTIDAPPDAQSEEDSDDAQNLNTFKKNVPYKVTLYWVWPNYFRNYIYTQRSKLGDLFTKDNEDRQKLIEFVGEQNTWSSSRLFYQKPSDEKINASSGSNTVISGTINDKISDNDLHTCSEYYNQADEYIGNNVQYVGIEIKVTNGSNTATDNEK